MSTYKMDLGHLSINYASKNSEKIPLEELSKDFTDLYSGKIKKNEHQSRRKTINNKSKR